MDKWNADNTPLPMLEETVEVVLASPGRRVAANMLNAVLTTLILVCVLLIGVVLWPKSESLQDVMVMWPLLVGGSAVMLVYGVLQLRWMARDGQSIGKKIMNIRVLRTDGSNPGFWGTVMMREVIFNLSVGIVTSIVGYLVVLFIGGSMAAEYIANLLSLGVTLVCVVMLFNKNKDRRTLQDQLANTVVVQLPKKH